MIGFDEYWADVRRERDQFVTRKMLDWELIRRGEDVRFGDSIWEIDWIRFSSLGDTVISGWISRPACQTTPGAAMLWLPGYSFGTPVPDGTNLVPGATTMCINVHGRAPDEPYTNPAGKNDYITRGIDDPRQYILRNIAMHCLNAVDVLQGVEWVDRDRLVVGGMSQGGMLALIVAAQQVRQAQLRACLADMPFLCSVPKAIRVSHSPTYKAILAAMRAACAGADALMATLSLFDPLNHAPFVKIPTALTAGGKDPASPAVTIAPVYDAIGSTIKQYRVFPQAGHVFLPEMLQTNVDWITRFASNGGCNGYC